MDSPEAITNATELIAVSRDIGASDFKS